MRWLMSLLLIWSATCPAETVLFQGPGASNVEYRALLKANGRFLSPTQNYMATHPSPAAREQLLKLYSEAQKAFVGQPQDEARRRFQAVAELAETEDWSRTEREIFLYSYLRLAQLETEAGRRDAWLANALVIGIDVTPDRKLFPPPLLERLEQLRRQAPPFDSAAAIDGDWTRVLINGIPCSTPDCPRFPNLPVRTRITFLSDKWQPQTVQSELSTLAALKPERLAWVKGSCGHSDFSELAHHAADKKAFFSLACEKDLAPTSPTTQNLDLKPQPVSASPPLWAQATSVSKSESRPFYRSPWFWAGVGGVLLAGAVLANQNRGKNETQTTTTYGN